jgi:FAD-dependent urate hydroxylase
MRRSKPVAIIGAGPYALSTAAFLGRAGIETQLYGEVMGFWHTMPTGMFLRSYRRASNIADPEHALILPAYERAIGRRVPTPIPLADFIEYGHWYRQRAGIAVDPRMVRRLTWNRNSFRLVLTDGDTVESHDVVVAAGITPFAWRPPLFERINRGLVSHSSEHREYGAFERRQVAVVGGGQSALESAAFLREAGAATELIVRRPALRFLRGERLYETAGSISSMLYPAWGVGPPGVNWLMGLPTLFRLLPVRLREPLARRAVRPAGAAWVLPRLDGVRVTTGRTIVSVEPAEKELCLTLDDGTERIVDHVVLGTGYRVNLARYEFLDPDLLSQIRLQRGYPRLSSAFESSVRGLYFVGAPAARHAGPGMRFVSHTGFVGKAITQRILKQT